MSGCARPQGCSAIRAWSARRSAQRRRAASSKCVHRAGIPEVIPGKPGALTRPSPTWTCKHGNRDQPTTGPSSLGMGQFPLGASAPLAVIVSVFHVHAEGGLIDQDCSASRGGCDAWQLESPDSVSNHGESFFILATIALRSACCFWWKTFVEIVPLMLRLPRR